MRPLEFQDLPAVSGADFIRDGETWRPIRRTFRGWKAYAEREARRKTRRDHFTWVAHVVWVETRNAYRINYSGQEVKP